MPMSQMKLHHAHQMTDRDQQRLNQLEHSLKKLPKMLPIEKSNINELMEGAEIQYFGKGETVIQQGDLTGSLYVILEGKAHLEMTGENDEAIIIGKLEQGDFFGEITVFTEKFSSFSVRAQEDLKVINVSQNEVLEMVEMNPRLAEHLDEMMDARRSKVQEIRQN